MSPGQWNGTQDSRLVHFFTFLNYKHLQVLEFFKGHLTLWDGSEKAQNSSCENGNDSLFATVSPRMYKMLIDKRRSS